MGEVMTAREFAAATRRRSIAAYGSEEALDLAIANHDVDRILARRERIVQRRERKPVLKASEAMTAAEITARTLERRVIDYDLCPECDGTGESWDWWCDRCEGKGYLEVYADEYDDDGYADDDA